VTKCTFFVNGDDGVPYNIASAGFPQIVRMTKPSVGDTVTIECADKSIRLEVISVETKVWVGEFGESSELVEVESEEMKTW
jgi:hypothetical protein